MAIASLDHHRNTSLDQATSVRGAGCRGAKISKLAVAVGDIVALTPEGADEEALDDDAVPEAPLGMVQAMWETPDGAFLLRCQLATRQIIVVKEKLLRVQGPGQKQTTPVVAELLGPQMC